MICTAIGWQFNMEQSLLSKSKEKYQLCQTIIKEVPIYHFSQLVEKYEISGIPSLIVVSKTGQVISMNGRSEVTEKGPKAFQIWLQCCKSKPRASMSSMGTSPKSNNLLTPPIVE